MAAEDADTLDFLERYVLAENRLKETTSTFTDDTEDYWYFSLLYLLNNAEKGTDPQTTAFLKKLEGSKFKDSPRVQKLLFRQQLKDFKKVGKIAKDAKHMLGDTISILGGAEEKAEDEKAVTKKAGKLDLNVEKAAAQFLKEASDFHLPVTELFNPPSIDAVASSGKSIESLTAREIDGLVELLADSPPTAKNLIPLIQADLQQNKTGFGARGIHRKLTVSQLKDLASGDDKLYKDQAFVETYAAKLRPVSDVNFLNSRKHLHTYLSKLKDFASTSCKHASMAALILFNYLKVGFAQTGKYDKAAFGKYLDLSKRAAAKYSAAENRAKGAAAENPARSVDTTFTVATIPELEPIGEDEPFVRRVTGTFFMGDDKSKSFPQLDKPWALVVYAEVTLMAGKAGEKVVKSQRQAISDLVSGGYLARFEKSSILELDASNKPFISVEEPLSLKYTTKNNPEIVVNVYELNALNYYLEKWEEITTDVALSGAVPRARTTKKFKDKPVVKRIGEDLTVKSLKGARGVYILDFIGNGVSARAYVRKGELRFVYEQTPNGYDFFVFTEKNELVKNAKIIMGDQTFESDEKAADGKISLPFADGTDDIPEEKIIVVDTDSQGSATLRTFYRQAKQWNLKGGFYVDRENLLEKQHAKLLARANLYLMEEQASLSNVDDAYVEITTKALDGAEKTSVHRVTFKDNSDVEIPFLVPGSLREIVATMTVKVGGSTLNFEQKFALNGIDACPFIADVFLLPHAKHGYKVAVLGKNGESFKNESLEVHLYHRFFSKPVIGTVKTDSNGECDLGKLVDVTRIVVKSDNPLVFGDKSFQLLGDIVNVPSRINRKVGSAVRIPFSSNLKDGPTINVFDVNYSRSFSGAAKFVNGYVEVSGLEAGDYFVHIEDVLSAQVSLQLSAGADFSCHLGDYVLSNSRILQLSEETPLQIAALEGDAEDLSVRLSGFNDQTRVHVVATALLPAYTPYASLAAPIRYPDVLDFVSTQSSYSSQNKVDPEYVYIMQRAGASKFIGNSLPRPSLLQGAWNPPQPSCTLAAQPPPAFRAPPPAFGRRFDRELHHAFGSQQQKFEDTSNVEWLARTSAVFTNLKPGADGVVKVPKLNKGDYRVLQIIAADDDNTALHSEILSGPWNSESTDVRLNPGLDPVKHFAPLRKILCLNESDAYEVKDFKSAAVQPFESVSTMFDLFTGLLSEQDTAKEAQLNEFRPLMKWASLSLAEKLAFYDKFMCNEVNFFLYRKDPEFFKATVTPMLQNKLNKSFFDLFLLGRDVSKYTSFTRLRRLNVFEKILVGSKAPKETLAHELLKQLEEEADLIELDPKENDRIFDAAKYRNRVYPDGKPAAADADGSYEGASFSALDTVTRCEERNYYNVPSTRKTNDLIGFNRFWKDYGIFLLEEGGKNAFLSPSIGHASSSVNEILLALAVTDLPLQAAEPSFDYGAGSAVKIVVKSPAIVFLQEFVESQIRSSTLSVYSNYFDPRDPYETVHGEKVDKFITGSFHPRKMYGCRAVVTNVSSVAQTVEALIEIPSGAIPVNRSYRTRSSREEIPPFQSLTLESYFYFPMAGGFQCYPAHLNKNGETVGYSMDDRYLKITVEETESDASKESWAYLAKAGTAKDIVNFLAKDERAHEVDLSRLSAKLLDPKFFDEVTKVLKERLIYDPKVWVYSLVSDKGGAELAEYLAMNNDFVEALYPAFHSDKISFDAIEKCKWAFTEYWPLVYEREHGGRVDSAAFNSTYSEFLEYVAYRSDSVKTINVPDKLLFVNMLLSQGRLDTASKVFGMIPPKEGQEVSALAHDYLACYLAVFSGQTENLMQQCLNWQAKPLPNSAASAWKELESELKELEAPDSVDAIFDAAAVKAAAEADTPFVSLEVGKKVLLKYRNVTKARVNFYSVDLELLFSESPFSADTESFGLIAPNDSKVVDCPKKKNEVEVEIPKQYAGKSSIVEVVGKEGGIFSTPLYDHSLTVQVASSIGEVRVLGKDGKPVRGAYVKVYCKWVRSSEAEYYKDGYTDLRGRFNYLELSTDKLTLAQSLSMFVYDETNGSTIVSVPLSQ